ncbi:MAG: VWA domain-containing protein, partial [Deltaproteobacteria bacterium]|nr:VWA domain-containing protein [Deltaproteobacteria bacterium]
PPLAVPTANQQQNTQDPPKVDVVFVLDTTGSMGGLIEGAKRKIWSIANQILAGQPRPHVRIGLIGYRDKGDAYLTRRFDLTENVDEIYLHLRRFEAAGGGDHPEHVNLALYEAINGMRWRQGNKVLRQIYLVGDAPPHEGRDGLYSEKLAKDAQRQDIVINAVRCGANGPTEKRWKVIAQLAGGMYASIRQDGGMVAISTPMDKRLEELNRRLTATLLPSGSLGARRAAHRRAVGNAAMAPMAQAESAAYRARSGRLDSADLLTRIARGKKLGAFKESELPKALAAMPAPKRAAYVQKIRAQRKALGGAIDKLDKKRRSYIAAKKPKTKGFDDSITKALKKQGKKAGLAY